MAQANQGQITDRLHRMILRVPFARRFQEEEQVLPPALALLLEFAAFASIPLIFMAYLLFSQASSGAVPASLYGTWKTSAPQYADRFLEISEGVIMFGTGGDTLESYVIDHAETRSEGEKTLYTITYLDQDMTEFRLSFYYEPRRDRLITFKYQDHLKWARVQE